MELKINETRDGFFCVLSGRIDTVNVSVFEELAGPLFGNAGRNIVIDCAGLEYISSSGLRQFLTLRKAVAANNGSLKLRNLNGEIIKVFTLTGFVKLFDIE